MTDHPILFSTPMVQAILREENPKTETRRIMKPQPPSNWSIPPAGIYGGYFNRYGAFIEEGSIKVPVQPGDLLWVRETWWIGNTISGFCIKKNNVIYKADQLKGFETPVKWRPSIHMPRKYSRITLEVLEVYPHRIQDISEESARAEGARKEFEADLIKWKNPNTDFEKISTHKLGFKHLWNSIHSKDAWSRNDWVWVYCFKRVKP